MTRTLTYSDTVQISKATLDTVRDIAHAWHDPANGQYFAHLREQASIDADGAHVTDENGNPLYDVSLAAELRGVPDENISTEMANLADAINAAFPAEWPDVGTAEVSVS
jgi:hypothetical protein